MFSMFWQAGVLIVLVALIDLLIRKWAWPQLRYALWLLVLVKLILPPSLTSPTSLTSNLQPLAQEALAAQMQKSETTKLTSPTSYPPPLPVLEFESITKPMPLLVQAPPPISVPLVVGEIPIPANSDILPAEKENLSAETITVAAVEESVAAEAPALKVKLHGKFYLMLVWSLGIWILTGWFILHWRQLTRQVRKQSTTGKLPDWFFDSLRETAELLGLRRIPRVAVSSKIATPAVFGLFRPTLLMPTTNLDKLSRRDARHVLLHELAHIKRRDPLVHTFNLLIQIVYWFNPLLWLVRRQLQHLRELCCDATVAKVLQEQTPAYRETLLETAKRLLAKRVEPGLGLLGLFENSNRLVTRLKWLEKKTWKHARLRLVAIVVVIAAVSACILPMAQAQKDFVDKEQIDTEPAIVSDVADSEKTEPPKFAAILSNGVTVELVGVCEHPSEDKQWWRPDGGVIEEKERLYSFKELGHRRLASNQQKKKIVEVAMKVRSQAEEIGIICYGTYKVFANCHEDIWANTIEVDKEVKQQDLRFGIAAGPWKMEAFSTAKFGRRRIKSPGFAFTEAYDTDRGHAAVSITHMKDIHKENYRVIATDRKDHTHVADLYLNDVVDGMKQTTVLFKKLKANQISHFEFQTRPYEWVTFKNVSLQPGHKTSVQELKDLNKGKVGGYSRRSGYGRFGGFGGRGDGSVPVPAGPVKQRKLIKLEAQFLHIPTTLISTLKSDQKGVVATLLGDLEKGKVATSLLDPVQIDFLIRFCQASKDTQVLTTPKVVIYAGETADISFDLEPLGFKFAQGFRMRVSPILDDQDRIRLDIQLTHQKITQPTRREEEYARGFYGNQVNLQARLQSGQSLLAALPEDFLTDFHTKKSSTPTQILMILKAKIIPPTEKPLPSAAKQIKSTPGEITAQGMPIKAETYPSTKGRLPNLIKFNFHVLRVTDIEPVYSVLGKNIKSVLDQPETKRRVPTVIFPANKISEILRVFQNKDPKFPFLNAPHITVFDGEMARITLNPYQRTTYPLDDGMRIFILPRIVQEDKIFLDIQAAPMIDKEEFLREQTFPSGSALGVFEKQAVIISAILESQSALFAVLPDGFLDKYQLEDKPIMDGKDILIIQTEILPREKPTYHQAAPAQSKTPIPGSEYFRDDRPWKWYLAMEELRNLHQQKNDGENRIKQLISQKKDLLKIQGINETHPDFKFLEINIKSRQQEYELVRHQYEEASRKMQDLEEKIMLSQEMTNQLRFLQQQQQKLEQRILDARIEYESAESVPQQKKAESLLQTLQKQRDIIEQKLQEKQEEVKAIRRQMN